MASSVFLGRVEKLFALEVIFWQVFICTFLSAELRRHLIKSVACQEQADCREEGGSLCVSVKTMLQTWQWWSSSSQPLWIFNNNCTLK